MPLKNPCSKRGLLTTNLRLLTQLKSRKHASQEPMFKKRFANHKSSFANPVKKSETCLSKYIWKLKDRAVPYEIKWSLHKQSFPYQCGTRKCDICLSEKLAILKGDPQVLINKRSEIMNKCRHKLKYKLPAVK